MRIYLAGPMRGYPGFNWPAFDRAAAALRRRGHQVTNPAELDRADGLVAGTAVSAEVVDALLERDLAILAMCGAIALLPGWEASAGATVELAAARRIGLLTYRLVGTKLEPLALAASST